MVTRKILVLLLTFILIAPMLIALSTAEMAKANAIFGPSPPSISFNSPVNTTYNVNDVNLTVHCHAVKSGYYSRDELYTNFSYSIDENKFQSVEITNSSIGINPGSDVFFEGLISLHELSEGPHNLTVRAVFNYSSYYINTQHESVSNAYLIIDAIPDNNWLPILSIHLLLLIVVPVVAVIAVVALSAFVYNKRRKVASQKKLHTLKHSLPV